MLQILDAGRPQSIRYGPPLTQSHRLAQICRRILIDLIRTDYLVINSKNTIKILWGNNFRFLPRVLMKNQGECLKLIK